MTPIVLVDNSAFPGELTGTAYLDGTVGNVPGTYAGMNLELNLDAYTGTSPLTLIDAPPDLPGAPSAHLVGVFGTVTFLGSRTATVNYDYLNGNVFLNNFQNGAGAGIAGGFRRAGALWPGDDDTDAGPAVVFAFSGSETAAGRPDRSRGRIVDLSEL